METSGCEPADLCQAFSDVILNTAIRDVDADDYANPMLCSEYVKDVYQYLRQLEVIFFCFLFLQIPESPDHWFIVCRLNKTSELVICKGRR